MNLVQTSVRQPVTVTVGVVLVLLAGLMALRRIPIQLTPNVEDTVVAVTTTWEGASPQEIEQDIVDEQEERLQGVANLRQMTSTSQQGQGQVRLEFSVGTPKETALREVSDKLREVPRYPENADEPVVEASDPENQDYIAWILLVCEDPALDVRTLNDFAEDRIKPYLERVAGVSEVNVLGGRERETQVVVDPQRLAQRGLSPADLVEALRATNRNVSAGRLEQQKADVRVRLVSQYERIEDVERTVLAQTPGGPVLVRDVAEVVRTYKEPTTFVRSKGRPVIAINAQKEVGANVMEVMAGLREAIARLNADEGALSAEARRLGLTGRLYLDQVYDQTVYIDDALALVQDNIWIGGTLAVAVLLLFLRSLRSSLLIALAIPISVIGAVAAMVALGRTINVISLAGMAFAVGMVVDNAIVVLENIYRHLELGRSRRDAALHGAREVFGAVLASTLTTVVVFVPILLVQEEAGQLFRDIALAIVAAVTLSLLVSVTVIPCAAARLLPRSHRGRAQQDGTGEPPRRRLLARLARPVTALPALLGGFVRRANRSVPARLAVVALLTTASVVGTVLLMPPLDYLPTGNRNMVFGLLVPPPGYSLAQQGVLARRIEDVIRPFYEAGSLEPGTEEYERSKAALPSIPTFDMAAMAPGPPVVPPPIDNYFLVSFDGIMFHGAIATEGERVADYNDLFRHATRPEIAPGVLAFSFQMPLFRLGGRTGSAVKVNFSGDDLDEVVRSALSVYGEIVGRYGVFSVQPDPSNFNIPGLELRVEPDLVRLGEVGLTPTQLGLAVQTLGDGAIVGEYRVGGQTIDLKVLAAGDVSLSLERLADAPIATPRGGVVPLSALARLRRVNAPPQINRNARQRSVTLQVTPPTGVPLEQAMDEIDVLLASAREGRRIPATVLTSTTGSASKLAAVQAAMLGDGTVAGTLTSSMALALLVTYLLMCVLFQSFLRPLVIMFSVPLATVGGFAALAVVHAASTSARYMPIQNLDILTMLGFVILIGVVVNNAILIVHQSLNFMRGRGDDGEAPPLPPGEAIAEAVRTRVRPILMTSATSVGGMLPLVLMPGSGSELYRGLGAVVVGGLVVSTVFTLLLVPLLLSLLTDLQLRLGLLPEARGAPRGRLPGVAIASAVALLLLPGCAPTREAPPPSLAELVEQSVAANLMAIGEPAGDARVPTFPESPVHEIVAGRRDELEELGGPTSWNAATPPLSVDLLGHERQVVPLRLERAVTTASMFNLGIELSRLLPEIDAESVLVAEAAFDTALFADASFADVEEPRVVPTLNGIPLGRASHSSRTTFLETGLRKPLATGGSVGVGAFHEYSNDRTPGISFTPDPGYRTGVGVSADVPLLRGAGRDVGLADIEFGENQLARSRQLLRSDLLLLVAAAEQAYWDLAEVWGRLRIQEQLTRQGLEVERVLGARQVFDVEPAQFSDAVATVERRQADLVRERRAVEAASDRLLGLMNDPEHPPASEVLLEPVDALTEEPLSFRLHDALATALRQRPEIAVALLDVDDSRVRQALADDDVLPLLGVSARAELTGLDDDTASSWDDTRHDGNDALFLGLSFEVPLGNRAARAAQRRARREQDVALVRYRETAQNVVLDVKSALRDVETSYSLIGAARAARVAEAENLRTLLLLEEQRTELTPEFLSLKFQRQERLAMAQRNEVAALADYNRAVAAYFRALGIGSRLGQVVLEQEPTAGGP